MLFHVLFTNIFLRSLVEITILKALTYVKFINANHYVFNYVFWTLLGNKTLLQSLYKTLCMLNLLIWVINIDNRGLQKHFSGLV